MPILYNVSKNLDPHSQRNFFLANKQLYNSWHIQITDGETNSGAEDGEWHDINNFLDLLLRVCDKEFCDAQTSYMKTFFTGANEAEVYYLQGQQAFKLRLGIPRQLCGSASRFLSCAPFHTKDHLFHKLLGAPSQSVEWSFICLESAPNADWQQMKSLAENLFMILKGTERSGYLTLGLNRINHDVILISHHEGIWSIDWERCIL